MVEALNVCELGDTVQLANVPHDGVYVYVAAPYAPTDTGNFKVTLVLGLSDCGELGAVTVGFGTYATACVVSDPVTDG